jgi:hypothetical protein
MGPAGPPGSDGDEGPEGPAGPQGPPGPGSTVTTAEIDFGTEPQWSMEFAIDDPNIDSTMRVVVSQSSATATDRIGNDTAWDQLLLAGTTTAGQVLVTALAVPGPVVGKRVIQYQISP